MTNKTKAELGTELQEVKKELTYSKRLAKEIGDRRLRETEELSNLIAEHKKTEKALQRAKDELEERTAELSKANLILEQEVSERRKTEEALRLSENLNRTLVENTRDIIYANSPDGEITYLNPSFETVTGWAVSDWIGKNIAAIVHPDDLAFARERLKGCLNGGKRSPIEMRILSKPGEYRTTEFNRTFQIHKNKIIGVQGIARDITNRKLAEKERERLELQLKHAQRMEALGTLAGGIAHDFNNLLMGIQGNVSLMLLDTDSTRPHYQKMEHIEQYTKNGADLTKQLLGFARGGKYEVKSADLNILIEKSSRMFGSTRKEIKIHKKYNKQLWMVEVDQGQIEQVLLNLYVNAWQAMPGGGELYLGTENVVLDENFIRAYPVKLGNYVKISVTDTGLGMDEATQQRIFDPFFTTKEMGRGTGLGLASVYGIIKNHNGIIDVSSEKGEGATFNIYLPASEKEIIGEKDSTKKILKGSEIILLVDDEDMIIDINKELLEELGYKVITAMSGREALEIYERNQDQVDMVILDMIMPDMGGGETYDGLKQIDPEIIVLLSSGYSINGLANEILDRGCNGFIQKPFGVKELSHKIREILDR